MLSLFLAISLIPYRGIPKDEISINQFTIDVAKLTLPIFSAPNVYDRYGAVIKGKTIFALVKIELYIKFFFIDLFFTFSPSVITH